MDLTNYTFLDRRAGEELLPRRRQALPDAAGGQHVYPQARRLGRRARSLSAVRARGGSPVRARCCSEYAERMFEPAR